MTRRLELMEANHLLFDQKCAHCGKPFEFGQWVVFSAAKPHHLHCSEQTQGSAGKLKLDDKQARPDRRP